MKIYRVLLVDDVRVVLLYEQMLLHRFGGVEVRTAESARAAIAIARALEPDLVIMDYSLPHQNGLGVLQELRARSVAPRQKAILTVRPSEESMVSSALGSVFHALLVKPISDRLFLETLSWLLPRA